MSDTVLIERADGIARVTLNRPEVLNALNDELCDALVETLAQVEREPETRVMVLQGAGGYFMAGGDLQSFYGLLERTPDERRRHFETMIDRVHAIIRIMRRMPQPVIAKIDGAAGGFGLSLVLACDLAVSAADSIFTMAYCRIGTSPDGSSTWFLLPRTVGAKKAMELALLGDRFGRARGRAPRHRQPRRLSQPARGGDRGAGPAPRRRPGPRRWPTRSGLLRNSGSCLPRRPAPGGSRDVRGLRGERGLRRRGRGLRRKAQAHLRRALSDGRAPREQDRADHGGRGKASATQQPSRSRRRARSSGPPTSTKPSSQASPRWKESPAGRSMSATRAPVGWLRPRRSVRSTCSSTAPAACPTARCSTASRQTGRRRLNLNVTHDVPDDPRLPAGGCWHRVAARSSTWRRWSPR